MTDLALSLTIDPKLGASVSDPPSVVLISSVEPDGRFGFGDGAFCGGAGQLRIAGFLTEGRTVVVTEYLYDRSGCPVGDRTVTRSTGPGVATFP